MLPEGMYDGHGPPSEDADIAGQILPIPVQFALNVGLTDRIDEKQRRRISKDWARSASRLTSAAMALTSSGSM